MNVKIKTEGVFDGQRVGVGSVVEVSPETLELNSSWMEATEEPVKPLPPAKEKTAAADGDK